MLAREVMVKGLSLAVHVFWEEAGGEGGGAVRPEDCGTPVASHGGLPQDFKGLDSSG